MVTKQHIIDALTARFERDPLVFAFWLEGSEANGGGDELSDIDLVLDVEDTHEEEILGKTEKALGVLGELDLVSPIERPNAFIWYQVFHLRDSSEFLLIDVSVQRHSRDFAFTQGDPDEQPKIIFDKANAIRIEPLDTQRRKAELADRARMARAQFARRIGARKYIQRGNFLEAWTYYEKCILRPLVQLLRIKYRPGSVDYGLVHASHHFPPVVVKQLEHLYQAKSLEDITEGTRQAEKLFATLERELDDRSRT